MRTKDPNKAITLYMDQAAYYEKENQKIKCLLTAAKTRQEKSVHFASIRQNQDIILACYFYAYRTLKSLDPNTNAIPEGLEQALREIAEQQGFDDPEKKESITRRLISAEKIQLKRKEKSQFDIKWGGNLRATAYFYITLTSTRRLTR